jgi:hypothetical protein
VRTHIRPREICLATYRRLETLIVHGERVEVVNGASFACGSVMRDSKCPTCARRGSVRSDISKRDRERTS